MTDWRWVEKPGNVGELPVKILENGRAEFILDFAENARVGAYSEPPERNLVPGDVCIFTAEILDVEEVQGDSVIDIDVLEVEFIKESDERDGASGVKEQGESSENVSYQDMIDTMKEARERRIEEKDEKRCGNCREIDGSTSVTVEDKMGGRDLHYCAQCGHLLSTKEYEQWKAMNTG